MTEIICIPAFSSQEELNDTLSRAAWHFDYLQNVVLTAIIAGDKIVKDKIQAPDSFADEVQLLANHFIENVRFVEMPSEEELESLLANSDVILQWRDGNSAAHKIASKHKKGKRFYRTDPIQVRQEGSFYIQCAIDSIVPSLQSDLIEESKSKFDELAQAIGQFETGWVLATGPSVENFKQFDFRNALTIVCNSTILDEELLDHCLPKVLVFADPIFHFGVSQYAGEFRKRVRLLLGQRDIFVVVPFKYYPLLKSQFPEFEKRIIGVPFEKGVPFNLDLSSEFRVKTTANILTLLLLPLVATFAKDIRLLGCDGRAFEDDEYFWKHGKRVQFSENMTNIQDVHPGFFNIDYNEYYFDHCLTLENLIVSGEKLGKRFEHMASSYIPALSKRDSGAANDSSRYVILVEPDGIGDRGHYVNWFNQLVGTLAKSGRKTLLLCHVDQDPKLYDCDAFNVLPNHSWHVARSSLRDFTTRAEYMKFREALADSLTTFIDPVLADEKSSAVVFMYCGAVQFVHMLNEIFRSRSSVGAIPLHGSICLFHESVFWNSGHEDPNKFAGIESRWPNNTKAVLLEPLARSDTYRVKSVSSRMSEAMLSSFDLVVGSMPNPQPHPLLKQSRSKGENRDSPFEVLFPGQLKDEKGSSFVQAFFNCAEVLQACNSEYRFVARKMDLIPENLIEELAQDLSDEDYENAFASADIVVLPYRKPHFTYRTSGVFTDAVSQGLPVIAIAGTWLGDQVQQYRLGLNFEMRSPESLLSCIDLVAENYGYFKANAVAARTKYEANNSWEKLVDDMFSGI